MCRSIYNVEGHVVAVAEVEGGERSDQAWHADTSSRVDLYVLSVGLDESYPTEFLPAHEQVKTELFLFTKQTLVDLYSNATSCPNPHTR
jgi:hypothetical protein